MRKNRICNYPRHSILPSRNHHTNIISNYIPSQEINDASARRNRRIWSTQCARWGNELIETDFKLYLFTFMFDQIAGGDLSIIRRMMADIGLFYSRALTRFIRDPNTPKAIGQLPVLFGVPDRPVFKYQKIDSALVRPNDGLHFHGCFFRPRKSRVQGRLDDHFDENLLNYTNDTRIRSVDVRRVRDDADYVIDYVFKAFRRGLVGEDVLVLPRALAELPSKKRR